MGIFMNVDGTVEHYAPKCPKCDLGFLRVETRKGLACDLCGYPYAYTEKCDAKLDSFDDRQWLRLKSLCPSCGSTLLIKKIGYAICHCSACKKYFDQHGNEVSPGTPYEQFKEKEVTMAELSPVVIKHFPKTEDAVVVERRMGREINYCPGLFDVLITDKEPEILARAKQLDEEAKETAE